MIPLALLLSDQCEHTIKIAPCRQNQVHLQDRQKFKGSLLQQFHDALSYLVSIDQASAKFADLAPWPIRLPARTLKEALLNAIVHRDYSYNSSTISIFDDRMEFVSMGGLPQGINAKDIMLGISHSRTKN